MLLWLCERQSVCIIKVPAVPVNTNEIIPQREPETIPVGISVHVILICSNPFRANPNLSPSFPFSANLFLSSFSVFLLSQRDPYVPDAGYIGSICNGEQLLIPKNGRNNHDSFSTAIDCSLQPGEDHPSLKAQSNSHENPTSEPEVETLTDADLGFGDLCEKRNLI